MEKSWGTTLYAASASLMLGTRGCTHTNLRYSERQLGDESQHCDAEAGWRKTLMAAHAMLMGVTRGSLSF